MDLKKIFIIFAASLFSGIALNFTNFHLDFTDLSGILFWLCFLVSGSFFGAFLFNKANQQSLLPFSMPLSFLICGWATWICFHFLSINILALLMMVLGIWSIKKLNSETIGRVLVYNTCFIVIFWLVLVLNSFHPEIYWGEKPMDFNLLNFMGRATSFPPQDPWAWGNKMKYYYFGYFLFGKFGISIGLKAQVIYQLALATSAGFFFLGGLSFMRSLNHRFSSSLKGASLLFFATSIGGWLSYFLEGKRGLNSFWGATRVFKGSGFSEYPIWSYLFGDLHPHVMSYAYALFVITLMIRVITGEKRKIISFSTFIFGFSWASLLALNSWDIIFCSALFFLMLIFSKVKFWKEYSVWGSVLIGAVCWSPILLSLMGGKSASIRLYIGENNSVLNYFQHQGLWWLLIVCFLVLHKIKKIEARAFAKALFASFLVLFIFTEFFVFIDRINTIFKFGNQLFILLGLITLSLYRNEKSFNITLWVFLSIFVAGTLQNQISLASYTPFGTKRPTLDGTLYMNKVASEDKSIINYIQSEVTGTPLILETYGKSFENNKARISMQTGLPTYLGWEGHVIIRGTKPRETLRRKKEIDALYNSIDPLKSYEWLRKKGIKYLIVGGAEHAKYPAKGLAKFKTYVDLFVPVLQTSKANKTYGLYRIGK